MNVSGGVASESDFLFNEHLGFGSKKNGSVSGGSSGPEEDEDNPVWGMPMFESEQLANLTDEEYLAVVSTVKTIFRNKQVADLVISRWRSPKEP